MGRVLQKKKNRSSRPKVRPHRKGVIKVPQDGTIAARWNARETLSQNYRRLGLTARLKGPTGGVEKNHTIGDAVSGSGDDHDVAGRPRRVGGGRGRGRDHTMDSLTIIPSGSRTANTILSPKEVRVERDSKGAIIRIIDSDPSAVVAARRRKNPLDDPLNDLSSRSSSGDEVDHDQDMSPPDIPGERRRSRRRKGQGEDQGGTVVQELESLVCQQAARPRPVKKLNGREADWVARLVATHGDDYDAMFWDRRLNVMQLTANALRRRVQRWRSLPVQKERAS